MKEIKGTIASPKGFLADAVHAQLKYKNLDLGLILSQVPAAIAGVFTTNKVCAAPVLIDRQIVKKGQARAIICNSAVANAVTGEQGYANALKTQKLLAEKFELKAEEVAVCSTGVIGVQLPMEKIATGISKLSQNEGTAAYFAKAILTTDTQTKTINFEAEIGGQIVNMAGVCKGSGMIHPNMATMLAFITTDAKIAQALLQKTLSEIIETTFNQITVDGDTSTNDTVLLMANGQAKNNEILEGSSDYLLFKEMLAKVCQSLAKQIAADGEGATKLIEVTVKGAPNDLTARFIAKKLGSSLVKTAIFGADPNWGRIISSIGQVANFEVSDIELKLQDELVLYHSTPVDFDAAFLSEKLKEDKIEIIADLNAGSGLGQAWGCDLTYKYVEINALYTS